MRLEEMQPRSLPEGFGQLVALQALELDLNQLSSLPESFGQLSAAGIGVGAKPAEQPARELWPAHGAAGDEA